MTDPVQVEGGWDRTTRAGNTVRERLRRSITAPDVAGVPYAVIGGNAVAAWVGWRGLGGVRNTPNVDLLVRRPEYDAVKVALAAAGFVHRPLAGDETFSDGPGGKPRPAIKVLFAGERVRPGYRFAAPDVSESEAAAAGFRVLALEPLVRMKLTSYRVIDRVHLRDMIDVGLVDGSWPARLPADLGARLQHLLDDPDG